MLFTENETNNQRLFGSSNAGSFVKDGINDFIVSGKQDAVNPRQTGTKVAAHYQLEVGPRQTAIVRLRLTEAGPATIGDPFGSGFDRIFDQHLPPRRSGAAADLWRV